ncbi:hypothetical protein [Anaerotignum sp. MB30-C6]|uniref:hypothetical protein n=1 Tax=Anaerotignum sp. MB30-C6 TaxID=3070814 RepID=UPI0027DC635B|nr:hypothetical protein [Anaerotignum sp. MB30-C6]WMI81848.1 hypothetical protein RBQ60_03725 [Anaerotignum sp. MB30-C6]
MFCSDCGKEVSGKFCCHCGSPLQNIEATSGDTGKNEINYDLLLKECEYDKEKAAIKLKKETGLKYRECLELLNAPYKKYINANPTLTRELDNPFTQSREMQSIWSKEESTAAKCPNCGSTSLSANKKGYGFGKATIGLLAVGPAGLLAGGIGAKGVTVTCLSCGHQFKAGEGQ